MEDVLDSLNRFNRRLEEPGYMEAVLYFMSGRPEETLKSILLSNRELPDTAVVDVNDITGCVDLRSPPFGPTVPEAGLHSLRNYEGRCYRCQGYD